MDSTLSTNVLGQSLLVTLPAGVDADVLRREAKRVYELVAQFGMRQVVLDCSSVEVMDGGDFAELVHIANVLRMMGRVLVICGLRPAVAFTAVMLDLDVSSLEFVGTLDEANARTHFGISS